MKYFHKDEHNSLKCPVCMLSFELSSMSDAKYDSTVRVINDVSRIEHLTFNTFYDTKGDFHSHPTGTYQEHYRCSKGHEFSLDKKYGCWCGWRN